MQLSTRILTISLAGIIFLTVIELIREEKLTFKYASGWLLVSILAVFFAFFDKLLFNLAAFFGFELASNFIFFGVLAALIVLSLLMTIFLCQQNNRNDAMAQKIGILEFEINQLKKELQKSQKK
ncbi:MAG: DUF2304 domain-containing protein [Candidatus Omnitrophica bacterium]|nr:DUF2304 domain-containing protein [Candidatus Omnitrophota bacterium]